MSKYTVLQHEHHGGQKLHAKSIKIKTICSRFCNVRPFTQHLLPDQGLAMVSMS